MPSEIVASLIGLFCTIVSSVVTFILTKRKYNTEVDSQQIRNMSDAFDLYKKTMEESLSSQKARMEAVIQSQNDKIDALQKENNDLRQQVSDFKNQVNELQLQIIKLFGNKLPQ